MSAEERPLVVLSQTALVAALIVLPLFYTLVPPLEDYPNHLARMFVLAGGDGPLSQFYRIAWAPIPNLIMDIVVPPLTAAFDIYTAGRIFIGATLLLLLVGPMLLHRALYRSWSAWPLVGGIFVYNGFLLVGLMNYLFGIGIAICGLAAWIALSGRPPLLRLLVSLACCALLYVSHLVALGVYGLAIATFELWRLRTAQSLRPLPLLRSALVLGLPFAPFLYILVQSPTWGLARDNVWLAQGKLDAIETFLSVYSDWADVPLLVLIAIAVATAVRRGLVRFHSAGALIAAVLALTFFVMPRQAFGSWMADQRLVVAIAFFALGFISINLRRLENQNVFFAVCLAAVAFRVVDVSVHWASLSQPLLELKDALHHMPAGARLLVAEADNAGGSAGDSALSHAPNLAVIERSALVSRLFVVDGKQIVHARAGYREHVDTEDGDTPKISQIVLAAHQPAPEKNPPYWKNWPRFFDYLIVLGTDPEDGANPAPDLLQVVHIGHGFSLYRIAKPPTT